MPRTAKQLPATELDTYCATCPPVGDVTALLAKLGFRLAFHMEVRDDLTSVVYLPALPAQYHYRVPPMRERAREKEGALT